MSSATVFVVDDEASMRRSLGRLLRAAGYDVELFACANDFLRREPDDRVGCMVLDVKMPDLDGLGLQQLLAKTDRCVPIIFITGHGDVPTSVRAMKAGAVDFLSKPFRARALSVRLRAVLGRKSRQP